MRRNYGGSGGSGGKSSSRGGGRAASAANLLEEEKRIRETIEELKKSAVQLSKDVREKEEEARKLRKRVVKLKKENDKRVRETVEEGGPPGVMGGGGDVRQGILERKPAAEIFPEEIWLQIFGYLSAPEDLWNCCNTCHLFEKILRPWKTGSGWMMEQALPHLYRHLPGNKLLECRLVSKGWKGALDGFFENHPSLQPHPGGDGDQRDPRDLDFVLPLKEKRIGLKNCFPSSNPFPEVTFTDAVKNLPRAPGQSPFICRYVTLNLVKLEDDELDSFLEEFGDQIWYLHLIPPCTYSPFEAEPIIERIVRFMSRKLFKLLPNLRKLSMDDYNSYDRDINPSSFPPAPKLVSLCDNDVDHDGLIQSLIRRYHGQLQKTKLKDEFWRPVSNLDWGQLTELHLNFRLMNDNSLVWVFQHGGGRMPQLSKLILTLDVAETKSKPTYETLLEIINGLTATTRLSTLCLEGNIDKLGFRKSLNSEVNFDPACSTSASRLKNLEIRESLPSFDFLLRCFPFVENLSVAIREGMKANYSPEMDLLPRDVLKRRIEDKVDDDELKQEGVVEVRKFALDGQMYKSNMWQMLPLLKVFTFQWDVYSRDGFEAYSRREQSRMDAN